MGKNKICVPRVLKNISYVIAPIILGILIVLIVCLSYPIEREAINNKESYYETTLFAERYTTEIVGAFSTVKNFQGLEHTSIRDDIYITEELVEGNTWGDSYWGYDLEKNEGKNILGKLLMQVRKDLSEK